MPRGATFVAPTPLVMVRHPSPSSSGKSLPGVIIGVNADNGARFRFDPWLLMQQGVINAMTVLIIAAIREGKSALIKLIIERLMRLAPAGRTMRGVINDYRPEGDGTEYSKLANHLGCIVTRMRDMQFNILDPRLYVNDQGEFSHFALFEMVRRVAEFEREALDEIEMLSLRIAMHELTQKHELLWGFDYIANISGAIEGSTYKGFRDHGHRAMDAELEARLIGIDDPLIKEEIWQQHRQILSSKDNIRLDDLQAAGIRVRNRLEAIYDGIAGNVFGRKHSYYDLATQPLSVRDWRGLSPDAERLLKLIIGRIDIAAVDNNRRDLIGDFVVDDELHRAMRNPQFVKDRLYLQQITRSLGRLEIGGTHTPDSVLVGEPGSSLNRESQTILNNTGMLIFGRLPKEEKIQQQAKMYASLTDYEVKRLTQLPKYHFGVKYNPSVPLTIFRTAPFGETDLDLIETDSATRDKTGGVDHSPEALAAFASRNGAEYIGEK